MGAAPASQSNRPEREMSKRVEFPLVRSDPEWVPDGGVTICQCCKSAAVGMGNRHHCRKCGQVCCKQCTIYQFKGHRVCKECISLTDQLGSHVMQYVSNERLRWVQTESSRADGSSAVRWQPAVLMCKLPSADESSAQEMAVCTPRNTLARVSAAQLAQAPPVTEWRQTMVDLARAYTELADSCSILSPNLTESNIVLVFDESGAASEYEVDTLEITEDELYVVVKPKQKKDDESSSSIELKFHLPDVRSLYSVEMKSVYSKSGMLSEEKESAIPSAEETVRMGDEDLRRGYQPAPLKAAKDSVLSPEKDDSDTPPPPTVVTEEEMQQLREELGKAVQDLEMSSNTVFGLNQQLNELQERCEAEKKRADDLQTEMDTTSEELGIAKETINNLNDQIQTLNDERAALEQRVDGESAVLKSEKEELQKQLEQQTEQLAELDSLKVSNEALSADVARLQGLLDEQSGLSAAASESEAKVTAENQELQNQVTELQSSLAEFETVKSENGELSKELGQLKELVASLQAELALAKTSEAVEEDNDEQTETIPEREEEPAQAAEEVEPEREDTKEEEEDEDGDEENDLDGGEDEADEDGADAPDEDAEPEKEPQTRKAAGSQSRRRKRKKSKRKR